MQLSTSSIKGCGIHADFHMRRSADNPTYQSRGIGIALERQSQSVIHYLAHTFLGSRATLHTQHVTGNCIFVACGALEWIVRTDSALKELRYIDGLSTIPCVFKESDIETSLARFRRMKFAPGFPLCMKLWNQHLQIRSDLLGPSFDNHSFLAEIEIPLKITLFATHDSS